MIRDLELAKHITVKDFSHFVNRKPIFPHEIDPLLGNSLLGLKDNNWRKIRARLSSPFTISKIKIMLPLMIEVADNTIDYIRANQSKPIDLSDLMHKYSNDVMVSVAFGIKVNSIEEENNEFYETGKDTGAFNIWKMMCLLFIAEWPLSVNIMKMLGIYITKPKNAKFFKDVIFDTINYRKKNNVTRPDIIQHLLEASQEWKDDEIVGQAYMIFLAGFETIASTLSMCIHALALHSDIQEKLYQDIKKIEQVDGLTYESLCQLKYMDCVLSETERVWSAAIIIDRMCSKTYDLPPTRADGRPYRIYPGDVVYIPPNSIHLDEKHFPDPKKFDPERFSEENKHNIKPLSFLPFGVGPRNCLGFRFAIPALKVMIYNILLSFKIEKCEKTVEEIKLESGLFNIKPKGGSWVKFESRN